PCHTRNRGERIARRDKSLNPRGHKGHKGHKGCKNTKQRARDSPRSGPRNEKRLANTNCLSRGGLRLRDALRFVVRPAAPAAVAREPLRALRSPRLNVFFSSLSCF